MKEDKPYVQTYSIVAGSLACNAKCPYCVSKMTPHQGGEIKPSDVNWRNFDLGAKLSKEWGAATALITSKGESTLFPEQLTEYMRGLKKHDFPMVELQTNGIKLMDNSYDKHLAKWYELGMTTISLSMTHYDDSKNNQIYQPEKKTDFNLEGLIEKLHDHGFSVRLSCIMFKDYIDSPEEVQNLIDFSKENEVEQLTVRSVERPSCSENVEVSNWVDGHKLDDSVVSNVRDYLDEGGTRLRELVHGAVVYDYEGQNICLSNCLTSDAKDSSIRQLILFPDGHVRYDWQHKGAILF
jgi:molybdenum cofactor biosynthesis enzyme MoaA